MAADETTPGEPNGPEVPGSEVPGSEVPGSEVHGRGVIADLIGQLRAADAAIATAIGLLMTALDRSVAERLEGLPVEQLIGLDAARTSTDRRMLVRAAVVLVDLPVVWSWFRDGILSWSQVRATVAAAGRLDREQRTWLDAAIAAGGPEAARRDPDRFVDEVIALADLARAERTDDAWERAYDRRFLAVQPALDGTASFYGEGDAETVAVIVEAIDAAAASTHHGPSSDHDDDAEPADADDHPEAVENEPEGGRPWRTRAQRRFDGLAHLSSSWLAGDPTTARAARPLVNVIADRDALTEAAAAAGPAPEPEGATGDGAAAGATAAGDGTAAEVPLLMWRGPGPLHLTPRTLERLACDAVMRTVLTAGAEVLGVAAPIATISDELRAALLVRDGRCRFPGCRVQARACHAHHIRHRSQGGPTMLDNLVCLCDHHHRLVHRRGWQLTLAPDATATFTFAHRTLTSAPRAAGLRATGPPPPSRRRRLRDAVGLARSPADPDASDASPPRARDDDLPF